MKNEQILIVGTGFAGLGMAIRLKQAGIHDFTILEQAGEVGGTWRDNHYPGAACDIESHLYSFSFEQNPDWTRQFANQGEILEYLKRCADKYGLRPHIRFHSGVRRAVFDERAGLWTVDTTDDKTLRTRVLVLGSGGLSRPSMPDIAGLKSFEGSAFHSARWDHATSLEGKTVAVVGTGASAIQIVPAIAAKVKKLYVFQRTPPWIVPKLDFDITKETRDRYRRMPVLQTLTRQALYWRHEIFATGFVVEPAILRFVQKQVLRYIAKQVPDAALRARVTPSYTLGCKRILLSNDYYSTLQRPNVELVTDGIDEVRARGIATKDGTERKVDAIVLATGFHAAEAVAPFEIRGLGGRDLGAAWREGAEAYLGSTVAGFPNLFFIVGPNTGLGHSSMVFMIESQVAYVLDAIKTMRDKGLKTVALREEEQKKYNERLTARLAKTVWAGDCNSWYKTRTGKNTTLWPGFTVEFRWRTRRFDGQRYELVAEEGAGEPRGAGPGARSIRDTSEPAVAE